MPYDWQHRYWWVIGPPLLLPVYFHYENLRFLLGNAIFGRSGMWKDSYSTKKYMRHGRLFFWEEIAWMASFFVRWHFTYASILGGVWGWITLYMIVRTVEVRLNFLDRGVPRAIFGDRHRISVVSLFSTLPALFFSYLCHF